MTTENRGKAMQLFDLVLIANELLPEQDRMSFNHSKYATNITISTYDDSGNIQCFWWVYYDSASIPLKNPPEKHEYLTLEQAIERVWEMISSFTSRA